MLISSIMAEKFDSFLEILPSQEDCYTYEQVGDILGIPVSRVAHMVKKGEILEINYDRKKYIPKVFFDSHAPELNKHISGLISLLSDGGFTKKEILRWIFTPQDDVIPGKKIDPASALHTHSAREIMRRAQSLAL